MSGPLAAQALVQMAECYQKLGDAESRKIYEQPVRDYIYQNESVAVARARLGNNESERRRSGPGQSMVGPIDSI